MPDKDQFFDDLFPALDSLHPTVPIARKQPYEQVFTSPGTWSWPGRTAWVDVVAVGGGGGGSGGQPGQAFGGAGGGGVKRAFAPVSGPVPVTVGAGGTVGSPAPPIGSATAGTVGGTSGFGPLGPGPVPGIPATTVAAGGGGGAGPGAPAVPTIGGGTGNGGPTAPTDVGQNGTLNNGQYGGGALSIGGIRDASFNAPQFDGSVAGSKGKYGFGGGGLRADLTYIIGPTTVPLQGFGSRDGGGEPGANGETNRGGGAGGSPIGTGGSGGNGGSGIVIVRWWE